MAARYRVPGVRVRGPRATEASRTAEEVSAPTPGPWRVVKALAAVITPLTLITALMYYFGLLHAYWFFGGFGVDYTIFNLTAEDFILRSADGLIAPFIVAALLVLTMSWVYQLVAPHLSEAFVQRLARVAIPVLSALGLGLLALAGVAFVRPAWFMDKPGTGGLALVLAVLLLTAATSATRWIAAVRRSSPVHVPTSWAVAEWTAVVLLVAVGLFWAVGDWSARVGSQRANDVIHALPTWPAVTVYSTLNLGIDVSGVTETHLGSVDGAAFPYRYEGLVLVTQEGGKLLLLPRSWTEADGTAIVLAASDELRLEFRLADGSSP